MKTCTFPDCDRPHRAKGWCAAHYHQQSTTGTTWAIGSRPRGGTRPGSGRPGQQGCAFDGCDRPHYCKALCAAHYRQHSKGRELAPIRTYVKPTKPRRKPTPKPTSTLPDGWHAPTPKRAKRAKAQAHSGDSTALDTDTLIAPQLDDATRARARAVVISHGGTDLLDMLGLDAA